MKKQGNNLISLGFIDTTATRIAAPKPLIQVILGPRQVGKTTGITQLLSRLDHNTYHYVSADAVFNSDWSWINQQWKLAESKGSNTLLVIDEVQKIENWSEIVKKLWDETRSTTKIRLILLGSSSLAIQAGLSESLTGRFELIRAYHWNLEESKAAFGFSLEDYLIYGGYPGSAALRDDFDRWYEYIKNSIVETVLGKDILQMRHVARPALFKQVFELLCTFPAMEISYRKLVGQLQDPGSIDTIKHYIELLEGAFLVVALQKFSTNALQKKSSSPKILPLCSALHTFASGESTLTAEHKGRLFELAVGLDLLRLPGQLFYWRQGNDEVDYVYKLGTKIIAIEVKSGRRKSAHGLAKFSESFPKSGAVIVTPDNYGQFASDPKSFLNTVPNAGK